MEYGCDTIVAASTGNAATALACLAAAAGLRAVVFVPASAPPAKLVQMASYGARLVPVDGSYDDAFELSLQASARFGWYNRNTAYNPFTIEGKKTAALEIAAQMAPRRCPDVVVVPTGDGVIVSGVAKGFADLERAGLIARRPRLLVVQPEGSGAIARALRSGAAVDHSGARRGQRRRQPRGRRPAQRRSWRSRRSGPAAAPGCWCRTRRSSTPSAASPARPASSPSRPRRPPWRACSSPSRRAWSIDDERVVLLVTGTGLKDVAAAARRVSIPPAMSPGLSSLDSLA